MKIPKSFKLFATKVNIVFDNTLCNRKAVYGMSEYSESKIYLSETDGVVALSNDNMIDAYYHEKVHIILDSMHEHELSENEKFVEVFAKLLRQSDETSEYDK